MDYKKVKKSSGTLLSIMISLLIVIAVFSMFYLYVNSQTTAAGVAIPEKYNDTFNELDKQQKIIDNKTDDIKENIKGIEEASNVVQVALNGLKSLGSTLLLTTAYVNTGVQTTMSLIGTIDVIPDLIIGLITMGLVMVFIFMILSVLKGDPKLT